MLTQPANQEISIETEATEEGSEEEIGITEVKTIGEVVTETVTTAKNKKAGAEAEVEVEIRREDRKIKEVHPPHQTAVDRFTT